MNKRLKDSQERVMRTYKSRRAVRNKADEEALHMFFSPNRVPAGLTNEEVRVCIDLYPRKKAAVDLLARRIERHARESLKKALRKPAKKKRILKFYGKRSIAMAMFPAGMAAMFSGVAALPKQLSPAGRMTRKRFKEGIAIITSVFDKAKVAA
ncbi:hypothetical protein KW799_00525 [Candidatus Parcubacteria bacterium]|nr:hypothetical protein [Candidatus Parcubacteria bacterium]